MTSDGTEETPNLFGMDRHRLRQVFEDLGAAPYHAGQVYRWLYSRAELDPGGWTDLSLSLRDRLREGYAVDAGSIGERTVSEDGTIKFRIDLAGGGSVESVYMPQDERVTLCISSQVGCALACTFCLTGTMGLVRNLSPGEIVGQVLGIREDRDLRDRSFNLVFMGMGEPLHNLAGVTSAIRILNDEEGFAISRRRITVSTSGLAPAIEKLSLEPVRPLLAISLNATTDEVRSRIMPVNRRYPLARLFEACRSYTESTGERITFEYVLLEDVNDSDADVSRLAGILRRHHAKLNLIPFNPVPDRLPFRPTPRRRTMEIRDRLLEAGIGVSIRWSRGAGARAACGQLALPPAQRR